MTEEQIELIQLISGIIEGENNETVREADSR